MPKVVCILVPILFVLLQGARSQVKRCPIKTINYEQGLTDNSITGVITDAAGLTWISTSSGIQRYNGYGLRYLPAGYYLFAGPLFDPLTLQADYYHHQPAVVEDLVVHPAGR
jgi:ligand-binding sensor domain-containing protein